MSSTMQGPSLPSSATASDSPLVSSSFPATPEAGYSVSTTGSASEELEPGLPITRYLANDDDSWNPLLEIEHGSPRGYQHAALNSHCNEAFQPSPGVPSSLLSNVTESPDTITAYSSSGGKTSVQRLRRDGRRPDTLTNTSPPKDSRKSGVGKQGKESNGSKGPQQNNEPVNPSDGEDKSAFQCSLSYRKQRLNLPPGCKSVYVHTEEEAIAHGDSCHYWCPICRYDPPKPRERSHHPEGTTTKAKTWRDWYWYQLREYREHVSRHLVWLLCPYRCGHRSFSQSLKMSHQNVCRLRGTIITSELDEPPNTAMAELLRDVENCFNDTRARDPATLSGMLKDVLIDPQSGRKKFDSKEEINRLPETTAVAAAQSSGFNHDGGLQTGNENGGLLRANPHAERVSSEGLQISAVHREAVRLSHKELTLQEVDDFVAKFEQSSDSKKSQVVIRLFSNLDPEAVQLFREIMGSYHQSTLLRAKRSYSNVGSQDYANKRPRHYWDQGSVGFEGHWGNPASIAVESSTDNPQYCAGQWYQSKAPYPSHFDPNDMYVPGERQYEVNQYQQ